MMTAQYGTRWLFILLAWRRVHTWVSRWRKIKNGKESEGMVGVVCLWYLGTQVGAPAWYFVLLAVSVACRLVEFGINIAKK